MKLTKEEKRKIVMEAMDYLRECEDGFAISTMTLLDELGYGPMEMDRDDIVSIHTAIFREAKYYHIELDMSSHDGLIEGALEGLDYAVHNKGSLGPKCPYCGSRHTARILYGMPLMDEQMKRLLDEKIIVLGGCLMSDRNPDYHCNDCGRAFRFFDCAEEEE